MTTPESPYYGRILNSAYSPNLKERVNRYIRSFKAFEDTGVPAIPYISAWKESDREIWYEFVGRGLTTLLNCKPTEVAAVLRASVIDRHNYRIDQKTPQIRKQSFDRATLNRNRHRLREEGRDRGFVDAVYKLDVGNSKMIWLKDIAVIETNHVDGICLSLGSLTVVTKEMRAEEERLARERLEVSLQMAGAVCHELNQPLQTLSGTVETILLNLPNDDPYYDQVEKIMNFARQMGKITGKLMRITKYETKDYVQGIKIVDIDRAAGEDE